MLLVFHLDQGAAGLDEVLVDEVVHLVGGEDGAFLHHPHIAPGVDDAGVHIPEGGIADEIGVVVEEGGVDGLAVVDAEFLYELQGLCLDEAHQTVFLLSFFLGRQACAQQQCQGKGNYFLTFSFHPSREKSQSAKIGSIMM